MKNIDIPIEPEDSLNRLNGNVEFKRRNRRFGTYTDLKEQFPNNEAVLRKIFQVRFAKTPGGCPHCKRPWHQFKKVPKKLAFRCRCNYKVYPLKGTHLEQCRTPLVEIMEIIYELFKNKQGTPAAVLERYSGKEYETCLYNLHRISDWFGWSNEKQTFTPGSTIVLDEVYPKVQEGSGRYLALKRGKGSQRTQGVLVMTEKDDPTANFRGITKSFYYDKHDKGAVERLIRKYIQPENRHNIHTDESDLYNFLTPSGYKHNTVKHKDHKYVSQYEDEETGEIKLCSTNIAEGFNERIKTTIHRVYLGVQPKYLQLYVDRVAFNHSNKHKNFFEALDTLLDSLPDLFSSVNRRFKRKKRKRKAKNDFREAA